MRYIVTIFLAITTVILSGCASIPGTLTIYHKPNVKFQQESFTIWPSEKALSILHLTPPQEEFWQMKPINHMEYDYYSEIIAQKLTDYGMYKENPNNAKYIVVFMYVSSKPINQTVSVPIYGQTGIASSTTTGYAQNYYGNTTYGQTTNYTPRYGVVGSRPVNTVSYGFALKFQIYQSFTNSKPILIYDANIMTASQSANQNEIIPLLINGLFQNFPGENGYSKDIKIYI